MMYGEKVAIEVEHKVHLLEAVETAKKRIEALRRAKVIDIYYDLYQTLLNEEFG